MSRPVNKFNRRCFHFLDDGQPIRDSGFHDPACSFAHPDDKEWAAARPPAHGYRVPAGTKYVHRDRKLDAEPSKSRRRSRSPFRPPRPRSRSYSPRRAPSNASDSRMRTESRTETRTLDPRRDGSRTESVRASGSSIASPPPPRQAPVVPPPSSFAPPPPPPPASAAMPVPPPLPAALTTALDPTPKHSPPEEMKVMWDKVLPLMANCVEARQAFKGAQSELHDFDNLLKTERFTVLATPSEKERMTEERARLKTACDDRNKKVSAAFEQLRATNWWPVGPNQDESAAEKYRELITYARQLNNTAAEMYQAYVTKSDNARASGAFNEMDVDAPPADAGSGSGSGARPLKRRRVSDAASAGVPEFSAVDLKELEQRLEKLEEEVAQFDSNLKDADAQNDDRIKEEINSRFDSLSQGASGGPNAADLKWVEDKVTATNADVDELGRTVADLMLEATNIVTRSESLEKEITGQKEEIAAMQERFRVLEDQSKQDQQTINALIEALEALHARPPPPALPLEFILSAIDEPVRDKVQSVVRPMIDDLSTQLNDKIVKQDAETYGQLWGKLALTLQVVEAVSRVTPGPGMSPVGVHAPMPGP
ncbi:hypothetical protein B0H16DRAFT_1508635 [Mycena metata]|uniref:Uncharacterized protein n=1 Tax=Mycena metata TaxID=1033252 RepID=A0AAD7K336_9AGAR|nr:hypothetical protein B0H16DRAFT_1508635 [Mycena metata]